MFASLTRQLRVQSQRDVELTPEEFISLVVLLAPVVLMGIVWVVAMLMDVLSLPGGDLAASFLDDTFRLQIFALIYVLTVFAIVCATRDPVSARLVVRTLMSSLSSLLSPFLPRIIPLLEMASSHTTAQPVLATPSGVRFAVRPQPPILSFGFSPGTSPQLK